MTVTMNGPFSTGSTTSTVAGGVAVAAAAVAGSCSASHAAELRADDSRRAAGRAARSRVRPTRLANAWLTWTMRPRVIGDGDQVRDRVERVLQLAPRSHHVVEQLHVLDGARELASELVGAIEQVELAAGLDAHAFEDDRAERAAAAAQRHGHRARSTRRRRTATAISARGAPHRDGRRRDGDRRR